MIRSLSSAQRGQGRPYALSAELNYRLDQPRQEIARDSKLGCLVLSGAAADSVREADVGSLSA